MRDAAVENHRRSRPPVARAVGVATHNGTADTSSRKLRLIGTATRIGRSAIGGNRHRTSSRWSTLVAGVGVKSAITSRGRPRPLVGVVVEGLARDGLAGRGGLVERRDDDLGLMSLARRGLLRGAVAVAPGCPKVSGSRGRDLSCW